MTRELTVKQKKFVKAYIATDGNGQESAKIAYNVKSDAVARSMSSENLIKPNIKAVIDAALIKHNITIDAAIKPIADGLEAERPSFTDKDGNDHGGGSDHATRLKASSMALRLLGAENDNKAPNTLNNYGTIVTEQKNKYAD